MCRTPALLKITVLNVKHHNYFSNCINYKQLNILQITKIIYEILEYCNLYYSALYFPLTTLFTETSFLRNWIYLKVLKIISFLQYFVPKISYDLRFSSEDYLELELWDSFDKMQIHLQTAKSWQNLLQKLTSYFGRQPHLPNWIYNGAILGLQGGTEQVRFET